MVLNRPCRIILNDSGHRYAPEPMIKGTLLWRNLASARAQQRLKQTLDCRWDGAKRRMMWMTMEKKLSNDRNGKLQVCFALRPSILLIEKLIQVNVGPFSPFTNTSLPCRWGHNCVEHLFWRLCSPHKVSTLFPEVFHCQGCASGNGLVDLWDCLTMLRAFKDDRYPSLLVVAYARC